MVIESTGTDPADVVAVANLQWTSDHPSGTAAAAYTSEAGGSTEISVPGTFRRVNAGTWIQYSGLIVQNIGAAACNNFDVVWKDRTGATKLSYKDSLNPKYRARL